MFQEFLAANLTSILAWMFGSLLVYAVLEHFYFRVTRKYEKDRIKVVADARSLIRNLATAPNREAVVEGSRYIALLLLDYKVRDFEMPKSIHHDEVVRIFGLYGIRTV